MSCQGDSHSATSTGLSKRCELKLTHILSDPTFTPESRRAHCDALHNTFMANLKAAEIAAGRSPLILSNEPVVLSAFNLRQNVERKLMSCSSCTSQMESQLASIPGDPDFTSLHMSSAEIFTPRDTTLNPTEAQQKWPPVLQGAQDLRRIVDSGEHLLDTENLVRLSGSAYRYSDSVLTDPRGTPESVVCFKDGNTTTGYVTKLIPLPPNDYLDQGEKLQHQDEIFAAEARLTALHPENDFAGATSADSRVFHELQDPAAYAVTDPSSMRTADDAEKASLAQAYKRLREDAKWAGQPPPKRGDTVVRLSAVLHSADSKD